MTDHRKLGEDAATGAFTTGVAIAAALRCGDTVAASELQQISPTGLIKLPNGARLWVGVLSLRRRRFTYNLSKEPDGPFKLITKNKLDKYLKQFTKEKSA